ncbi:MAG: DUF3857 domain-containing protein [Bacteroidales bacterium]|nr:DUF3857 domain-containing protein [Bacteroidales bacterium]
MKKLFSLAFAVFLLSNVVYPQWKSSDIPDSLKRNADAVIRRLATDIKIIGLNKVIVSENIVVTVLNEQGKIYGNFSEYYDKDSRIEYVKGVVCDDHLEVVKRLKRSDFKDQSMVADYSIYEDNRIITYEVFQTSYPFTVEYECRKVLNTAMFIPSWYPQSGYRLGVEKANMKVSCIDSNPLIYKLMNIDKPSKTVDENGFDVFLWDVSNLKPIEKEPYSPSFYEFAPAVIQSVTSFTLGGFYGHMDSWKSYGQWLHSLKLGRSDLSIEAQTKVQELVKNETILRNKVQLIYKYMQSHTRYVSIQLGVGGWQPFPASSVEKNGYGDCKALVNYTYSLLKAAGIKSFYCPIGVGDRKIIFDDFPGAGQTNHIILCVPNGVDSLWLECTSQQYPFAFISHEFQNQKVLLVDGDSSRLVRIPRGVAEKNVQTRLVNIKLDSIGNAEGRMVTKEYSAELENLFPEVWSNKKDQAEIVQRKYRIPGIIYSSIEYQLDDNSEPTGNERISFKVNGYASQTGRRLFIPFNPFSQGSTVPVKVKRRLRDVEIDECFTHIDTITYNIPKGFTIEYSPKPKSISGLFGSYNSIVNVDGDKLITIRKYTQNRGKYPAKEYNNFIDFLLEVSKQDKQSLVLVNK